MHPLAIGLTGNIGSGKTQAAGIFSALGAEVLYADQIAKTIIDTDDGVRKRVKKEFGDDIYGRDGTLDRKLMARRIFLDASLKEKLERIVHPRVLDAIETRIQSFKQQTVTSLLVVEAALHYEAGAETMFDYMIVVDAGEQLRVDRLMQRDGSTRNEVLLRMSAQMPAKDKIERSDFVIHNNDNRTALKQNCTFLFNLLNTIAHSPGDTEM